MRGPSAGEHAGCVIPHGLAGQDPSAQNDDAPGRVDTDGRLLDALPLVLAETTLRTIEAVGGYAGGVYLRSGTPGLLRMAVLAGLPGPLFRPWWRMHVNRPFPIAEVHRSGQPVYLADVEEAMRQFPQFVASLPFPFASLYTPIVSGRERFGVLVVLRTPSPGVQVNARDRNRMAREAQQLGADLKGLTEAGTAVEWPGEPVGVQLPSRGTKPVRIGTFDWDLDSGKVIADDGLRAILGDDDTVPGTIEALTARLAPEDSYALWTMARRAAEAGSRVARRIRLKGPDGGLHLLEVSARVTPGGRAGRLTGSLVDLGTGLVGSDAVDRLPRAILAIDRLGRVTYVNHLTEALLGLSRASLAGRTVWEVLPWFGQPANEEHLRGVLLSDEPVHFLVHSAEREWLSVSLYPGHDGVTLVLVPEGDPDYKPGSVSQPDVGLGSPADKASALYRPVALAIALTEAVTARQVSAVVTDELLPAFGGRQLAIYLLSDRHLYLAWETGFPKGFLEPFDGVGLDAHMPGVEALTTGRPLFFESIDQMSRAYPDLPLDALSGARAFLPLIASGRPVGSCILGFDRPRGFSPEERTVLTALAGLIAQALERARRYDSESALAQGLQDALLPSRLPVRDHVDTVARYLPGTQGMDVGGDWYDVVETARGLLALVVGDVQGHGVAAAATMGQLRSAVRAFALAGHDPEDVLKGTNRLLIDLDPGQFASCCYVVLDPATGRAEAVRAGHPQPLLRRPDGTTDVLELTGGLVLGIDPEATYPVTALQLDPGAVLALYTDGLVERPGRDIDEGVEWLRRTFSGTGSIPLTETADRLIRDARQAGDRPDDIALLLAARWTE
ncbi:SpoIIE family protein phosphatase [Streptomyces sp. P9(2023)]|uniref:SpoIIE family protein phosphatase n=1 Tax=Streptomyces sp. P9(2023) TaxID=3064394 RepID=UPI0028F45498|nr:SpoIIE family protein phosphatase [Streptomyces sp. P9(2023)]MDT9686865.1 SpoIIE family protein phosphatase [Streptomyces sp. P9(2023)]